MNRFLTIIAIASLLTLAACGGGGSTAATSAAGVMLDVYKSETCGCCGIWTQYMEANGYGIRIHHPADLNATKEQYGIAPQWQSCHTAVTEDGYIFEGHIPAKFVQQFLADPPANATGLAVPGMPLGSPGMEVEDRFTPYDIVLLKKDGSTSTYAKIANSADQY